MYKYFKKVKQTWRRKRSEKDDYEGSGAGGGEGDDVDDGGVS